MQGKMVEKVEQEIREEVSKAIEKGIKLGMKKQILDDLEWIEDNFIGVRIFVETRDAIVKRKAKLTGILEGLSETIGGSE